MKRTLLLVALGFGVVAGYGSAMLRHYHYHHGYGHHAAWKRQVADICVEAADRRIRAAGEAER